MARFHLIQIDGCWGLEDRFGTAPPLIIDFSNSRLTHRRLRGGKKELLLKAIGAKPGVIVQDWTAGLGTDSFLMANAGCDVTLFERSPVIALLLKDAIARAYLCTNEVQEIASRMKIQVGEADGQTLADVIYLDPMFPQRKKSALVNGPMQYLQQFLGEDRDAGALVARALSTRVKRVVVKRPAKASDGGATFSLDASANRFDVYERSFE